MNMPAAYLPTFIRDFSQSFVTHFLAQYTWLLKLPPYFALALLEVEGDERDLFDFMHVARENCDWLVTDSSFSEVFLDTRAVIDLLL